MTTWLLLTIAVLALLALPVVRYWNRQIRCHREFQQDFFDAADVLVMDNATPDGVVGLLLRMGELLNSRYAAWRIFGRLLSGEVRSLARGEIIQSRALAALMEAQDMQPERRQQFAKAIAAFVLSMTHGSLLVGWLLRRLSFYRVRKVDHDRYSGGDDAGLPILTLLGGKAAV